VSLTRRGRIVFSLFGFLAILGLILGGGYLYLDSIGVYGSSDPGKKVQFEIPKGSSSSEIGEILKENDVIPSTLGWRLVTIFDNRAAEVQAGFYEIRTGLIPRDALDALLESGPSNEDFVNVTFPEGLWLTEMAARLEKDTKLDGDTFLDLVTKGNIKSSLRPEGVETMEGLLFPSTYQIAASDTEETVAKRLADEMVERYAELNTNAAKKLGLTDYELIIVASMIEAETRVDEERPMVARVIYNRLAEDIALGIDATFQYALGERKETLTASDLAIESPYNLRKNLGLPPTPIGAPGQASLEAAANPADGGWLFYVLADCEGNHAFSETNDEFLADKAAYQALDC
jgi:UPF0755 protein